MSQFHSAICQGISKSLWNNRTLFSSSFLLRGKQIFSHDWISVSLCDQREVCSFTLIVHLKYLNTNENSYKMLMDFIWATFSPIRVSLSHDSLGSRIFSCNFFKLQVLIINPLHKIAILIKSIISLNCKKLSNWFLDLKHRKKTQPKPTQKPPNQTNQPAKHPKPSPFNKEAVEEKNSCFHTPSVSIF